ncbi:DnaJ C-terminal domain-containing protein [Glycomyces paridis]|uniref:J domain-containing protein n=1 Tax=Glycomyces paridis TaxID=2126555 RepID=A0A4S8PE78_9ACTN|nr:DnaJ C-terminal domain-containing protein [Glycomyces paridis]THV28688.1 J domain-containing protein [Glycomyces paridis]
MPGDPAHLGAVDLRLTLAELAFGGRRTVRVAAPGPCVNCEGSGLDEGEACAFCDGSGSMTTERAATVRLQAGLADGDTVIVPVEGVPEGVVAVVREREHSTLTRDGVDLRTVFDVDADVLELGDVVDVATLDGEAALRVPAGTPDGAELRLPGEGMPLGRGAAERGDLLVELRAIAAPEPEAVREARRLGRGPLVAGVIMLVLGALLIVVGAVDRADTDICEPSETVRCVLVVDGVAQDAPGPGTQRSRADLALMIYLAAGLTLTGFGVRSVRKGLKESGAYRVEEGQRRSA